jgi:hypothetical protein
MPKQAKGEKHDAPNLYEGVGHIVHLSTGTVRACHHCNDPIPYGGDDFAENVNHYIEKHGYRLLHIGVETSHDADGKPWNDTVAVLGRKARDHA